MELLGREKGSQLIEKQLEKYLSLLVYLILPLTISIVYLSNDFLINHFLSGFKPGANAIKVVVLTTMFIGTSFLLHRVFMVFKNIYNLIIVSLVPTLLMPITFIFLQNVITDTLSRVAWSAVISQMFCFILSFIIVYLSLGFSFNRSFIKLLPYLFSFIYSIGILMLVDNLLTIGSNGIIYKEIYFLFIRELLFLLLFAPVIFVGMRRYKSEIKSYIGTYIESYRNKFKGYDNINIR
jgi:hypothetical protein